jgi:hypothetical protein
MLQLGVKKEKFEQLTATVQRYGNLIGFGGSINLAKMLSHPSVSFPELRIHSMNNFVISPCLLVMNPFVVKLEMVERIWLVR